jgi:hypothetical protein
MSIMLPPNLDVVDWGFFERQFRREQEPYDTAHLVGSMALYECVDGLEERLERGEPLSAREVDLLRQAEEDRSEEFYL